MKGQSLIEVLLALTMMGVILSGITVIVTSSLNNAQYSRNQNLATGYAQEALEITREIRNKNYSTFKTYSGTFCLGKTDNEFQANCSSPNIDNTFIRKVQIVQNPPLPDCGLDTAKATVTVSWRDGKCSGSGYCHKSELISCLSTITTVTAP